jgi:hypothetical protein
MSYSNNIPTWDGTTILTGNQVGWMGQLWTALSDTDTEPHPDNASWQQDTSLQFTGFGIAEIPDPKDYLKIFVNGFGIAEEHVNRPPEVKIFGLGLVGHRNKPYLIISTH